MMFDIREDDLSSDAVKSLLALHLSGMHENTPPENVFALDESELKDPAVTFWSVWHDDELAGIGALKVLADGVGELKSMRTHPQHLRRGVAAALLNYIIEDAKHKGLTRLSLETGRGEAFEAAINLYRVRGFVLGDPFADYESSEFSQFFHLDL